MKLPPEICLSVRLYVRPPFVCLCPKQAGATLFCEWYLICVIDIRDKSVKQTHDDDDDDRF